MAIVSGVYTYIAIEFENSVFGLIDCSIGKNTCFHYTHGIKDVDFNRSADAGFAAVIGVGIFVTALVVIGVVVGYQGLTTTGGFGVIAALGLFIIVMSVIGYWLSGLDL